MKITFEGSIEDVLTEMKLFLKQEISQNETSTKFNILEHNFVKVRLPIRGKKKFTEFEFNFIKDNYRKKSVRWIAASLQRTETSIYQILSKMYKKGMPKISKKASNLVYEN